VSMITVQQAIKYKKTNIY